MRETYNFKLTLSQAERIQHMFAADYQWYAERYPFIDETLKDFYDEVMKEDIEISDLFYKRLEEIENEML